MRRLTTQYVLPLAFLGFAHGGLSPQGAVTAAPVQAELLPRSVRDVEVEITRSERAELGEDRVYPFTGPDLDWLAGARRVVEGHLQKEPDDTEA